MSILYVVVGTKENPGNRPAISDYWAKNLHPRSENRRERAVRDVNHSKCSKCVDVIIRHIITFYHLVFNFHKSKNPKRAIYLRVEPDYC